MYSNLPRRYEVKYLNFRKGTQTAKLPSTCWYRAKAHKIWRALMRQVIDWLSISLSGWEMKISRLVFFIHDCAPYGLKSKSSAELCLAFDVGDIFGSFCKLVNTAVYDLPLEYLDCVHEEHILIDQCKLHHQWPSSIFTVHLLIVKIGTHCN